MVLPKGTLLKNDYVIEKVLTQNDNFVVYSGICKANKNKVRITEYLPIAIASRNKKLEMVFPIENIDPFNLFLEQFLMDARKTMEHRSNLFFCLIDCFEDMGTGFVVSQYKNGIPFLDNCLIKGNITLERSIGICRQIFYAIESLCHDFIFIRLTIRGTLIKEDGNVFLPFDYQAIYDEKHLVQDMALFLYAILSKKETEEDTKLPMLAFSEREWKALILLVNSIVNGEWNCTQIDVFLDAFEIACKHTKKNNPIKDLLSRLIK